MNIAERPPKAGQPYLYLAPLDGLRFFAFLAVFGHHLPSLPASAALMKLHQYGWVGVELFFAISAYLFFHLLNAEAAITGRISVWRFYMRRMLRIYPLMMAFPVAMLVLYGATADGIARLAALGLFLDNFVTVFRGYNISIPYTAHLWTLSFEFQLYLIIPFVFIAYRKFGRRAFLFGAGAVLAYCFLARMAVFAAGAKHPVIWVTPFLRPESIIAGMLLFVLRPQWAWQYSAGGALLAGTVFLMTDMPWQSAVGSAASYPLAAIMCAGLIDTALRAPWAAALTSVPYLTALGRISFGLYVFHPLSIALAKQALPSSPAASADLGDYALLFAASLAITIALSAASYLAFEIRVERLKGRFAVVNGRAAASPVPALGQG